MFSNEEINAIQYIKNIKNWWWNNSPDRIYTINKSDIEQFDILLNLIEKQDKTINIMSKEIIEHLGNCPYDAYEYQLGTCKDCQNTYAECWEEYFINKMKENN